MLAFSNVGLGFLVFGLGFLEDGQCLRISINSTNPRPKAKVLRPSLMETVCSHRGITVASTVDHELIDCEFDRDDEKTPVVCGRFDPSRTNDQGGPTS